jgi:Leucine-rich repeat (LRR) protein
VNGLSFFGLVVDCFHLRDLSSNHLSGSLPTTIGDLANITYMFENISQFDEFLSKESIFRNFGSNILRGTIPSSIGLLSNLLSLYECERFILGD